MKGKASILIFILTFGCYICSGRSQGIPAGALTKAFSCFNNKYIYSGCNEEYRLNESGELKVPLEATGLFCGGPCLAETQQVLNCVDNFMSNFIFYNRATVRSIRNALGAGCSYTAQRGNFNVEEYIEGEISNAHELSGLIACTTAMAFMIAYCFFIL